MQTAYAVMNKQTGQLFAGFDADNNVRWTADWRDARGQALLFAAMLIPAQQKPVAL